MTVIYRERMYHISRYTNKIDRMYLQKYILKDDLGWFSKDYNETSYWGLNSFEGDSYATGEERDLMAEGSTSRVYSFNIYIEPTVFTYYRSYKKIYIIFSESIPLVYIVSFIFHTINKKFSEFLFVNLKEKTDIFDKKIHEIKHGLSKNKKDKSDASFNNGNNPQNNDNKSNNIIIDFSDKKIVDQNFFSQQIKAELGEYNDTENKIEQKGVNNSKKV